MAGPGSRVGQGWVKAHEMGRIVMTPPNGLRDIVDELLLHVVQGPHVLPCDIGDCREALTHRGRLHYLHCRIEIGLDFGLAGVGPWGRMEIRVIPRGWMKLKSGVRATCCLGTN